ncbi:MAG: DUF1697 domain-containing protein [Actinomycetota bacterium]|nr:DUF1697 domain-containing protein [Actinomycetota bacterium]
MRYVVLLSGINVGKRRIAMSSLAGCFEDHGFSGVRTYIASGNVSFESDSVPESEALEWRFEKTFGFGTSVVLFSLADLNELLDRVSRTLSVAIDQGERPIADPKIEGFRFVVAVSNGVHLLNSGASVARVELLDSYSRGSLWRWTITDGRPPASMEKLFVGKVTTRFAHTLEKIYQNAAG